MIAINKNDNMDKYESLKELKKLLDEGIISEDEFTKEKQKVLNKPEAIDTTSNFPKNTQHNIKARTGNSKKLYITILSVFIALVAITFIVTYEYRKQHTINSSKSLQTSVKVYFDVEEVFPVHLLFLKNTKQGLFELTISNSALESKNLVVSFGFAEFGALESQTITVAGGSIMDLEITPYSNKLMEVFTTTNATLMVKVRDEQNNEIYLNTWSLKVHPCDELPWKIKNLDCTKLIASWVCPKDESVVALISKVKAKTDGNTGLVAKMNNTEFRNLVKAIFNIVRDEGISYINRPISFGEGFTQRVRLPSMTLKTKSANSIDGSILLASLFENVGLRPYIVILPGHVIVGVSKPDSKSETLFIETTLLGRSTLESIFTLESTFSAATKLGRDEYSKAYSKSGTAESGMFTIIDVYKARQEGILPIN